MQTVEHGAFLGGQLKDFLVFGAVVVVGELEGGDQFDNAARFCPHNFGRFDFGAVNVEPVCFGRNPHDSEDAGTKGGSEKVGGRKRFATALVVGRGIGDQFVAGLQMD